MNEDERGITPADSTTITIEQRPGRRWAVTIEQGNGDAIKLFELTDMERIQLGCILGELDGPLAHRCSFLDLRR